MSANFLLTFLIRQGYHTFWVMTQVSVKDTRAEYKNKE